MADSKEDAYMRVFRWEDSSSVQGKFDRTYGAVVLTKVEALKLFEEMKEQYGKLVHSIEQLDEAIYPW